MKIQITVETPEDDELHYPRIAKALGEYCDAVKKNNSLEKGHVPDSLLGMSTRDGPNYFKATNGVVVTELRIA